MAWQRAGSTPGGARDLRVARHFAPLRVHEDRAASCTLKLWTIEEGDKAAAQGKP